VRIAWGVNLFYFDAGSNPSAQGKLALVDFDEQRTAEGRPAQDARALPGQQAKLAQLVLKMAPALVSQDTHPFAAFDV
jgi:hypothetical protein